MEEVPDLPRQPERVPTSTSQHITNAEFASFQEYFYTATKENGRFRVEDLRFKNQGSDFETDLVKNPEHQSPAIGVVNALEAYFHLSPRRTPNTPSMSYGDLYCVYGEKNGKFIFQGAGVIHRDSVGRQNDSSLKLVFDSRESLEEFVQWMEEEPTEALAAITREIYPTVSKKVYTPRRWIGKLTMGDVNTGEVKTKSFERPILDQDMVNVIESQVKQRGSIDAVIEHYQKSEKEEPRFREDARAILRGIDAYKKEFLSSK